MSVFEVIAILISHGIIYLVGVWIGACEGMIANFIIPPVYLALVGVALASFF